MLRALCHVSYYYDDYLHHDERVLEIFEPYLEGTVAQEVVGGHLKLSPDRDMIMNRTWKNQTEVLKQEWVQMDWSVPNVFAGNMPDADRRLRQCWTCSRLPSAHADSLVHRLPVRVAAFVPGLASR